jgi:hypothetical protein
MRLGLCSMSVDANTGNAFLDSYARQVNRLERDPNATAAYDAALEKQFNEIKAQPVVSNVFVYARCSSTLNRGC